jgi:hypothetical protein
MKFLLYFPAIVLWSFDIFSRFDMLYQEKSGIPASNWGQCYSRYFLEVFEFFLRPML